MKTEAKKVQMLVVEDLMGPPYKLDPIRVITENIAPGQGRLILSCYGSAWSAYWGGMGEGRTVEEFILTCDAEYIADRMDNSGRATKAQKDYLIRVVSAAQEAVRSRAPKLTPAARERRARLVDVNALIMEISKYGRRFFWNEEDKRVSRMEMAGGKIWWVDSYRGTRVCLERIGGHEHRWQGFSNGGTLKSLITDLRQYVKTGIPIEAWKVGQDCWGYSPEAQKALQDATMNSPCLVPF